MWLLCGTCIVWKNTENWVLCFVRKNTGNGVLCGFVRKNTENEGLCGFVRKDTENGVYVVLFGRISGMFSMWFCPEEY